MANVIDSRRAAIAAVNGYGRWQDIVRHWLADGRFEEHGCATRIAPGPTHPDYGGVKRETVTPYAAWIARSPIHPDCGPDSLRVVWYSADWIDHATGAKGEDALTLVGYVTGLSPSDAAFEVASWLGLQIDKCAPALWPDKIRALNQLDGPDGTIETGKTVPIADIGRWYVEEWIERGDAEPVFNLESFKPELPAEGCSLGEVLRRHVEGDPNTSALLRAAGCTVEEAYRRYLKPAGWRATRDGLESCHLHVAQYREPPCDIWSDVVWTGESGYAACEYFISAAIHKFVKRLMDGELVAMGVWYEDLKTYAETKLDSRWWFERDVALNFAKGELWEYVVVEGKKKKWVKKWVLCFTHVRVCDAGEVKQPDPRSKKPEMIAAFQRLCEGQPERAQKKIARNMSKKEIWRAVLEEIGVEEGVVRGYGYAAFCKHLSSLIDKWTRTQN